MRFPRQLRRVSPAPVVAQCAARERSLHELAGALLSRPQRRACATVRAGCPHHGESLPALRSRYDEGVPALRSRYVEGVPALRSRYGVGVPALRSSKSEGVSRPLLPFLWSLFERVQHEQQTVAKAGAGRWRSAALGCRFQTCGFGRGRGGPCRAPGYFHQRGPSQAAPHG